MSRTTVVLADDHTVLREGLKALINAQPDLTVVGEAGSGPAAVEQVRDAAPRVLCLDLSMPGPGVVKTVAQIHAASPRTRVLVLTMHDDPAYVRTALSAGAAGYVLKTAPTTELLAALRAVAAGEEVISPQLRAAIDQGGDSPRPEVVSRLSRREQEVLQLLVVGHTHQEIADRLFLSVKSIETYRSRLREKLGLRARADFVRYGLEAGLLPRPESAPGDGPE